MEGSKEKVTVICMQAPNPVVALSKKCVCGRLMAEIWVRIPPWAWLSVSYECRILSGRGLCVGLITRPEESYREWCVWVWSWSLDEEALGHVVG